MARRKRRRKRRRKYTALQLAELEAAWMRRLLTAATKIAQLRRLRGRAEKQSGAPSALGVDDVIASTGDEATIARECVVDAVGVHCTTCHVGAGAECLRNGERVQPHRARIRLAVECAGRP